MILQSNNPRNNYYYNYYQNLGSKLRCGMQSVVGDQFRLNSFSIVSDIQNSTLKSKYVQVYENNSSNPVEAFYELPLPLTSSICDLEVTYQDQTFTAKIKEKQKAQEKYDDAIASGGQGFMITRDDNGIFKLSLGNIEPKTPITVTFTIIGEVYSHLESIHYFIHSASFPTSYKFKFSLSITVTLSTGISNIESLYSDYKIKVERTSNNSSIITFKNDEFSATYGRDLVFVIEPKQSKNMETMVELDEKEQTLALSVTYYPQFSNIDPLDINQKSEYIYILDCSGSMSGNLIESAKNTLNILMRSIPENSKFNIYRFGSTFKKLYETSKLYNNLTLQEATNLLNNTSADLGGTDLLPSVRDIFQQPYDPEYPRQIFVLTDGGVSDRASLISFVRNEPHVRMFTFGIGSGVDIDLVTGLSQASRGHYELITDINTMEAKVLKLLRKAMEPMLANIKLHWPEGVEVRQAPTLIRPIYDQERMMLYGLIDLKKSSGVKFDETINLKITADGPKGDVLTFDLPLQLNNDNKTSQDIHKLVGLMLVNDLTDQEKRNPKVSHKDEIIRISKQNNVLSKYTSLLITKESKAVTQETMTTVNVNQQTNTNSNYNNNNNNYDVLARVDQVKMLMDQNIDMMISRASSLESLCERSEDLSYSSLSFKSNSTSLKSGSSILGGIVSGVMNMFSSSSPSTENRSNLSKKKSEKRSETFAMSLPSPSSSPSSSSYSYSSVSEESKPSNTSNNGPLLQILKSQNADGSWSGSVPTVTIKDAPVELANNKDIWITLVVLAYLSKVFSSESDKWSLVAQKATKYVRNQLNKLSLIDSYDKLVQSAKDSL
ncbi:type A von Willebrand factor domain-containing protein [Tieghemostelium lacteum]|uniref:Type A von Willebrand factor domain-containing protein n=1 Tax=Tieghemostelium lacteum TaxID=361077 RepID=A0A151ZE36_TIELA|nr:type A von Willebrand factor domain-containing protein [Tieghemostelium lacteum]|eukprot:KYQ92222.1 type A von Willebrand factor domain-containing protein [Tieghemostelium lacteum]